MLCPSLMRSTALAVLVGIACSVSGTPLCARAEPSSKGASAETQALALYREAQALERAGKLRQALAKVQEAYATLPTPTLLWPLANLHARNGEPIEALRALSRYRRTMAPSEMEPGQQLADVEKLESQLRAQLAYVRIVAPSKTAMPSSHRTYSRASRVCRVMAASRIRFPTHAMASGSTAEMPSKSIHTNASLGAHSHASCTAFAPRTRGANRVEGWFGFSAAMGLKRS